jgi:hypothetical protein
MGLTRSLAGLAALLAVVWPSAASAQFFSSTGFEVYGGYYDWSGENVEGLEGGPRVQAGVVGTLHPRFALGAMAIYGRAGLVEGDEDVTEIGLAGIARVSLGPDDGFRLFLDSTLAWSLLRVSQGGPIPAVEQNGVAVGPSLGLSIPLQSDLRLVVAGDLSYNAYGDLGFAQGSDGADGGSGWRYGVRVGLAFLGD